MYMGESLSRFLVKGKRRTCLGREKWGECFRQGPSLDYGSGSSNPRHGSGNGRSVNGTGKQGTDLAAVCKDVRVERRICGIWEDCGYWVKVDVFHLLGRGEN